MASHLRVAVKNCEMCRGGGSLERLEDRTLLSVENASSLGNLSTSVMTSATDFASGQVVGPQAELTDDYIDFVVQAGGIYSQPDYLSAVAESPVSTLVVAFQGQLEGASAQSQEWSQQSQQQASSGQEQTATVVRENLPAEGQSVVAGGTTGSLFSGGGDAAGYADMMLQQSSGNGDSEAGGTGDGVAVVVVDPRTEWTPLEFPSDVVFADVALPAESFLNDLGQVVPNGSGSFSNTTEVAVPVQVFAIDVSLGVGERTLEIKSIVTVAQSWASSDEWTVTQSRRNEFRSEEESVREDGTTDTFTRTGFETLTVTIINGTRRIVTWSKSDTFGFGAKQGEDPAKYWGSAVPSAGPVSYTAVTASATPGSGNSSENEAPEDGFGFESGVTSHAEIGLSFEEQVVTLPDGSAATVYSFGFGTGRSFRSKAEGGYGASEKEAELKPFPSVLDSGDTGGSDGEAVDSQQQVRSFAGVNPGAAETGDADDLPPGTVATKPVEPGGNGSSLLASGGFRFGAGASTGESIVLSAVVPAGESIDNAAVSGGTSFFAAADTSAEVNQSIGFQLQESSGTDASASPGHEYLSFSASNGGGGSKDFHYSADSHFGGYTGAVPVYGRGNAATDAILAEADQPTPTSAAAIQKCTAEGLSAADAEPEEPTVDIGFGLKIKDHGNSTAEVNFSKTEHPSPVDTVQIGHGSGSSSSFSTSFDLGNDANGEFKLTARVNFSASGGSSTGIVRTFVMAYPSDGLQWLGPNAIGFVHKSTVTDGHGQTMSTNGDFTITVGVVGDLDVDATLTASFNEVTANIQKAENFATFDGGDGGFYHLDQTLIFSAIYTITMSGNLIDGFTTTTDFKQSSSVTEVATGTPPTTTGTSSKESEALTILLDATQTGLDIVGLIPALGEAADLLNAGIHVARGNYGEAALSIAAMVPVLGAAATAGKLGTKAAKVATKVAGKVDEVSGVAKNAIGTIAKKCDGPNCFIAGTQVVVAVPAGTGHQLAGVVPELPAEHTAPDAVLDIDRYFAAGGFMMAAALAARRNGKTVERRRRFRWFGRA